MTHNHQEPNIKTVTGPSRLQACAEVTLIVLLFFVYAGDHAPMVNEAHYLVKAKNFWNPDWCASDLFAASGKEHTTFYWLFGWPTQWVSLQATAWIGRVVGWLMIAIGLQRLSRSLVPRPWISLAVAAIWIAGIERGNLAGEWVIGGIEAKVPAYGLMLFALSELANRRWNRVWVLLGSASAFHVLSGGWAVIAAMMAWWLTEKRQPTLPLLQREIVQRGDPSRLLTPSLFLGGLIALFGLIPAIWLTSGVSSEDSLAAARIYSYFRIKHHLLPADFLLAWYVRHVVLVCMTIGLGVFFHRQEKSASWSRMYAFTAGAVLIALAGMLVGLLPSVMPDLGAKLLRYYWFRLTDAIVPLMFALLVARLLLQRGGGAKVIGLSGLAIAIMLLAVSSFERGRLGVPPSASHRLLGWDVNASAEQQRDTWKDWMAVCDWAQTATSSDAVFLTPRHQQTFKWYAQRAEVVNWKDVPQDAISMREWYRRFRDVFPTRLGAVRVTIQYETLRRYRQEYGANLMIVDRRVTGKNLPLVKVYPSGSETNETYAVYELP